MTYSSKLLKTMELRDFPGHKGISLDVLDEIIEKRERRANKRRNLCKVCFTMTSTDKTCFCTE